MCSAYIGSEHSKKQTLNNSHHELSRRHTSPYSTSQIEYIIHTQVLFPQIFIFGSF